MFNKYQHLGASLNQHEMKEIKGGVSALPPKTRWACNSDPSVPGWIDYICYYGTPPCPYSCVPAGACQQGDYQACVS